MASPVNDSYSVASGDIVAGQVLGPAWLAGTTAYTWGAIPASNTLDDIDPENNPAINPNYPAAAPWGANIGQKGVIRPWCGASYNATKGRIQLLLGGGHGDYAGNEPYVFELTADVPSWSMLRNPTGAVGNEGVLNDGGENTGVYFDGRPRAIHSYRKHVWTPSGDVLVRQGGSYINVGDSDKWTWTFDDTTGEWTYRSTPVSHQYIGGSRGSGMYDPDNNRILWVGHALSGLSEINLTTFDWTRIGTGSKNSAGEDVWDYIVGHNKIIGWSNAFVGRYAVWDTITGVVTEIATQGSAPPFTMSSGIGFCWVPTLNAVAIFSNAAGYEEDIYLLSPTGDLTVDPWQWSQLTTNGTLPTAVASGGPYTRFGYSAELNGFYYVHDSTSPVYFLPLS